MATEGRAHLRGVLRNPPVIPTLLAAAGIHKAGCGGLSSLYASNGLLLVLYDITVQATGPTHSYLLLHF